MKTGKLNPELKPVVGMRVEWNPNGVQFPVLRIVRLYLRVVIFIVVISAVPQAVLDRCSIPEDGLQRLAKPLSTRLTCIPARLPWHKTCLVVLVLATL